MPLNHLSGANVTMDSLFNIAPHQEKVELAMILATPCDIKTRDSTGSVPSGGFIQVVSVGTTDFKRFLA